MPVERSNRFDLYEIIAQLSVRAPRIVPMQLDAMHNGSEQFAHVAIDLQVLARVPMIAFCQREEVLEVGDK